MAFGTPVSQLGMPANAKLHRMAPSWSYILEQSGARVCFASSGIDAEIAPHAPKSLERLITIGSAGYDAAVCG